MRHNVRSTEELFLPVKFLSFIEREREREREREHVPSLLGGSPIQRDIQVVGLSSNSNPDLCMPQMIAILTPQPLLQENVAFVFLKSLCEMPTKLVEYLLLIRIHILTKKSSKKKSVPERTG